MIDSLINKDIELLIYLNNLGSVQWDGFWLVLTNKFSAVPLYLVLLYFTFKQFGFKKTMIALLFIALLITVSDQTSNLFKYSFKRLRPCHDESVVHLLRSVQERCGGLYGYFSAHAANSMAIAVFFSFILKIKHKIFVALFIVWALLVAYSRVYIGVHYPLDITTGILFGLLYGTLFSIFFKMFLKKFIR